MRTNAVVRGLRTYATVLTIGFMSAGGAHAQYTLGDLNGQDGWDGGLVGGNPVPFTNNNPGSNVIINSMALTGAQSWLLGGSYGSPGAGTPFTRNVATVGALNATAAGSPITPAGNKSVVSFAFKAVAPGDGSRINVYEGSYARDDRTGASLYLRNDTDNGNPAGTVSVYNFASANDAPDCDTPQVNLGYVAAGTWHTVEMTTVYPNLTVGDPSTYGSTTYVFDKDTVDEQTFTMQSWAHVWRNCNGFNYTPGGSLKWVNSFNDYPAHQGFYIDDLSMVVANTVTNTVVGSFYTSFELTPPLDTDGDGIPDAIDNCPMSYNPDQSANPGCATTKKQCEDFLKQEKQTFDAAQKADKSEFEDDQKADKTAFNSPPYPGTSGVPPTGAQKKAFDDGQKADKKAFDDDQKADKSAFDAHQKAEKKQCDMLPK